MRTCPIKIRVIYGMTSNCLVSLPLLKSLTTLSPKTNTPITATLVIAVLVLCLALFFPVETLAKLTSAIVFTICFFVNSALWRLKRQYPQTSEETIKGAIKKPITPQAIQTPPQGPVFNRWIPFFGALSAFVMLAFQVYHWMV